MAVFTIPEISAVGLTEEQRREQRLKEAPEGRLRGDLKRNLRMVPSEL